MTYHGTELSFWLTVLAVIVLECLAVALTGVVGARNGFVMRGYVHRETGERVAPTWVWLLWAQLLPAVPGLFLLSHYSAGLPLLATVVGVVVVALVWRRLSRRQAAAQRLEEQHPVLRAVPESPSTSVRPQEPALPAVEPSASLWSLPAHQRAGGLYDGRE